jgi:uncharacterized lipoprotein
MRSLPVLIAIASVAVLSGCASSKATYGPDGRATHSINCSGTARTWGMCEEKAGELCGTRGYDIISRSNDTGIMATGGGANFFGSSLHFRTMQVACKG